MTTGKHDLRVVTLLMDDSHEVRMYADDALENLD